MPNNMDQTDWDILRELQDDARLSYAEIGRRVGLSSPAVQERVRKLEDAGIIKGYSVDIDYREIGLPVLAITRLQGLQGQSNIKQAQEIAQTLPEIIRCYQVTGTDEFVLHIALPSIDELEHILEPLAAFAQCITSIVIRTPIDGRIISTDNYPYLRSNK